MRERSLQASPRGLSLCLCEWGPTTGPATLILHGFLEQGAAWDAVAQQLNRRVIAPDHRGHGKSGHVGAGGFYHFWNYLPDIDAIVNHIGAPVDLIGHSMGGTIACLYAAVRPQNVRRLALIEGLGPPNMASQALDRPARFLNAVGSPPQHRALANLADAIQRIRRFTPSMTLDVATVLAIRATRAPTPSEQAKSTLAADALFWRWDPLHRARNPLPFTTAGFIPFLSKITAPTLHVHGSVSSFSPDDQAERMAHIQNLQTAELPGGHMLHHDVPGELATTLASFLSDA